ncbi:hypothetical protein VD0002_g962 [Verticillium dahliae]|uniref:Uncharacterized protein n=3 Tax=Verticillium dahliae TaxID=27337 RepID=G2X2W7_VERDV|nr:uncharacterized protein VDAG_04161 [Verticillium dahliae VdLs.17]EGY22723.1 hypothetical protein VDAG_04161 [Verticillium dahliae VdLs.17]PNH34778.1 hypothetical protein BJF96_g2035 [Verticillium dahliae]PNH69333.1 hypothetical protein VD0002_g962 [Verticillium dahliae]
MDPRAGVPPCRASTPNLDGQRRFPLIGRRPSSVSSSSSPTPPATPTRASPALAPPQSPAQPSTPPPAGLTIRALIKFGPPLLANYDNIYEACRDFIPSDNICQGLLRRLEHGCHDLITRRDSSALDPKSGRKPLRFEAHFTITRAGVPWTTVTYRSYQKLPLDRQAAVDVAWATDRIIGTFLRRHDRGFTWQAPDRHSIDSRTTRPQSRHSASLFSLASQDRLVVAKQHEPFLPGYEVVLNFRSKCRSRQPVTWDRRFTIQSTQTTPLTPRLVEGFIWKLSKCIHDALDARKRDFDDSRATCDFLEEVQDSFEDGAVFIDFKLHNCTRINNPDASRSVTSSFPLFQDSDAHDAREFAEQLNKSLTDLRDETDKALNSLDDLKLLIREISGRDHTIKNPFAVVLDSSVCYAPRTIDAALDRVQSGIAHVLYGKDVTLVMAATKRGHMVLEKTIVGRPASLNSLTSLHSLAEEPQTEQEILLSSLKECIQRDIAMVILDTRSLSDMQARPPNLRLIERSAPPSSTRPPAVFAQGSSGLSVPPAEAGIETNETCPETTVSTAPAALPHQPETPVKSMVRNDDLGIEAPLISRESSADLSTITVDNEVGNSTPPSTPSLSDCAVDSPRHSYPTTPPALQAFVGAADEIRVRRDSDTSDQECEDGIASPEVPKENAPVMAKEPRRFGLLGKRLQATTHASDEVANPKETTTTNTSDAHVVQSNPAPAVDDPIVPAVQKAPHESPFEGWLGYSCEPILEEPLEEQLDAVVGHAKLEELSAAQSSTSIAEVLTAKSPEAAVDAAPADEDASAVPPLQDVVVNLAPLDDVPVITDLAVVSNPGFEGWLAYCCESLDQGHLHTDATQASTTLSQPLGTLESVALEDPEPSLSTPAAEPTEGAIPVDDCKELDLTAKPCTVDGAEAAEGVAVNEPQASLDDIKNEMPLQHAIVLETMAPNAAVESVEPAKLNVPPSSTPVEATKDAFAPVKALTLTTESSEFRQPLAEDVNDTPKTPTDTQAYETADPHTPTMTDDSNGSDSIANQDHSPSPFPELDGLKLTGSASSTSLTLWSLHRSPFFSDDFDFGSKGIESPSKYARPSFSRPQTSYGSALSHMAPALRRPQLQPHRRQFSSPTAGYLGLLHGHGSPLRMTSYVCSQLVDGTQDEGPAVRRRSLHRSPSSVLLGPGYEQSVEAQSRPGSSAGFRPRTDSMSSFGGRSRTGSIIGGAGLWMK